MISQRLAPLVYEGGAPKGRGEYMTMSGLPPALRATPLINEGGKRICEV